MSDPTEERIALVTEWRKNSEETIRRIWRTEYTATREPAELSAEDIEKLQSYAIERCLTEGLTEDFVVMANGRPDIDENLVHEGLEVWEYV